MNFDSEIAGFKSQNERVIVLFCHNWKIRYGGGLFKNGI